MVASNAIPPFLAFVNDDKDVDTLKKFGAIHSWNETAIAKGDIKTATQFLKEHTSPTLLLVEIGSANEAKSQLDALAEVCDPDTKVIIIGNVNEYSFYCWLMDIGISSYLLKPLTEQMMDGAYVKSQEKSQTQVKQEKPPAKVIALIGSRGGVGTSSLSINLAGLIAEQSKKSVALVDLDPQEGSLALTLDLEPSRGFREALEKPERMDALFIERVMTKPHKHLSVLSAEEPLQESLVVHEQASDTLLKQMRDKFDIVVLDVPRYLNPFTKKCLFQADHAILVTELTLLSLRDALRQGDALREVFKANPPLIVANRVGMAAKHEVKPADFEKGINAKVDYSIPYAPDIFMHIGSDIPSMKNKTHASMKVLHKMIEQLVPEIKNKPDIKENKETKKSGLFGDKKK